MALLKSSLYSYIFPNSTYDGENISLQLVDGTSLYDLSITAFTYVGNGMAIQNSDAAPSINCLDESIVSNCNQWFSHTQISSSDANMSVILGPDFTSSLGIENPNLSSDDFELTAKIQS